MIRLLGMVVAGALLIALFGAGWLFRDSLSELLGIRREPVEVSAEAATLAEEKITMLREEGEPAKLSDIEASSLLRYRSPPWLLQRVRDPSVVFGTDTVRLSGTVATADLPSHPDLDRVRMILPDSSLVEVTGRVRPLASGRLALEVSGVEFAGIPVPDRYFPAVLERLGRRDEEGLGPTAVAIPLPSGIGSVRVERGSLVLTR